jgi:hypothetical protein
MGGEVRAERFDVAMERVTQAIYTVASEE